MRRQTTCVIILACVAGVYALLGFTAWMPLGLATVAVLVVAIADLRQTRHSIRRNFPVIGHMRYLFESIRPEINQYFVESNTDGTPFNREIRSLIYQRAKNQRDTLPFGTRHDVYAPGFETVRHSLVGKTTNWQDLRVVIGGSQCTKPYDSSVLLISAMSYGALSNRAIEALNEGAKHGNFAHNTGEGGISQYHLKNGGDLVWQIGTGYFGCRDKTGNFDPNLFALTAQIEQVKMIEIKLSQGAKPSLGGMLPAAKVTAEIAKARGVPAGEAVLSPARHTAFDSFEELCGFLADLRHLSGGKPVGLKLCVGYPEEIDAICAAMKKTNVYPDFITVDGAEGGTGAAPVEFSNNVGLPLYEALSIVHETLIRHGLRQEIRIIASGKIATGFDIVRAAALGTDLCASGRGMLLALGCIQALRCDSNKCPTGIATQNPHLVEGLVVQDKAERVARFHQKTLEALADLLGAMGLRHLTEVSAGHVLRRDVDGRLKPLAEIYKISTGYEKQPYSPHLDQDESTGGNDEGIQKDDHRKRHGAPQPFDRGASGKAGMGNRA